MTVVAPPQLPPVNTSAADDPSEALIKEAKQRARRRRWFSSAAGVLAIAGVAAFATLRGTSPPDSAARVVPTPPPSTVAPLVAGPDAASTLLASWGDYEAGYAFVYADGRVIWGPKSVYLDTEGRVTGMGQGPSFDKGDVRPYTSVTERRLSARGLELVRTGKLHPKRFLVTRDVNREGRISIQFGTIERKGLWAEPTARVYKPSKYAICPTSIRFGGSFGTADALASLVAPAQALLAGKQHTYDPSIGTASWRSRAWARPPDNPPVECFEVAAAEASTLYQILDANGQIPHEADNAGRVAPPNAGPPNEQDWGAGAVFASPVFPHGQYIG